VTVQKETYELKGRVARSKREIRREERGKERND
jgi:hypothetical protein